MGLSRGPKHQWIRFAQSPRLCSIPPLLEGGSGSSYPNAAAEGGGGKFWGYVTFMLNPPLVRGGVGPFRWEQGGIGQKVSTDRLQ